MPVGCGGPEAPRHRRRPTGATSVELRLILQYDGKSHHGDGRPVGPQPAVGGTACCFLLCTARISSVPTEISHTAGAVIFGQFTRLFTDQYRNPHRAAHQAFRRDQLLLDSYSRPFNVERDLAAKDSHNDIGQTMHIARAFHDARQVLEPLEIHHDMLTGYDFGRVFRGFHHRLPHFLIVATRFLALLHGSVTAAPSSLRLSEPPVKSISSSEASISAISIVLSSLRSRWNCIARL